MSNQGVREIKVWYLEITEEEQFIPSEVVTNLSLKPTDDAAINTQFYREVGGDWRWVDRLNWTDKEWEEWVSRENLRTWVAHLGAEEVGYVEMEIQEGGSIEIVYFGLLPLIGEASRWRWPQVAIIFQGRFGHGCSKMSSNCRAGEALTWFWRAYLCQS